MQQRKSFFIEDYVFLDCLSGFLQNLSALRLCRDATTLRCRPISRLLVIDPSPYRRSVEPKLRYKRLLKLKSDVFAYRTQTAYEHRTSINEVGLKWIPTGKIFTSNTTKVDSDPTNGSDEDITNQYECDQTLDVSVGLSRNSDLMKKAMDFADINQFRTRTSRTRAMNCSRSKLSSKVGSHANKTAYSRQEVILFSIHNDDENPSRAIIKQALRRPYALSWKPCQGDSLNLPDHRIHKDGDGDASFQLKSDSLPHAHAQTTKTFYKHQDSRIMKAQELKTKTSAQTLIYKIFLQRYQVYQGRLLASFQDDAKYEHVGQDTRSQGGKDDQDKQGKDLKISDIKTKLKDNDKGSRSNIKKHEGTSLK
ncbi:hypothetical protein Tco_1430569 [Tanacetum coccineum]